MACEQTTKPVIFFDWDGTLADSMDLCIAEVRETLAQLGLPPQSEQSLSRCNGPTNEESLAILGIPAQLGEDFLRIRVEAEMMLAPGVQKLFRGIREMLMSLAQVASLAIVSNGMAEYLALSMQVTGVADCFTRVQGTIPGKTKAEVLALLLEEMRPERCVMVGDRAGDIRAGRRNGVLTVAACYGYGLPDEWAEADLQAYSVSQLSDFLTRFASGDQGRCPWTPGGARPLHPA